jgi:hypothetical protein
VPNHVSNRQKRDELRHRKALQAGRAAALAGTEPPKAGFMTAARSRLPIHGASLAVWAKRRPWRARVYLGGKDLHLGYFATREEARAAHTAAVKAHLGETFLKGHACCHD